MANRRIKIPFTPSPYQEKVFDFVEHGVGNGVIKASAGAGKTSTIITAMRLVPKKQKCLFIAFNKSIVEELTEKVKGNDNCIVKTIHSLGYTMIKRNLGSDIVVDEYKYRTYVKNNISDLTTIEEGTRMTRQQVEEYMESICTLIDYARFNLAQTVREIENVADTYGIPVSYDECLVALKCLEWGSSNVESVDYTDMVWLPYELSLKPKGLQYDWIFFDECQDASKMAFQLFLKCFKRGTRFCCVGDEDQAINMFAGSSQEAFQQMVNYPNTTLFKLPISYRCAKNIVEFANPFSPEMKPRDNAPDGEITQGCSIRDLKQGDMVLSRSKAPLVNLYVKLLRRNVKCYIKGQDIGENLLKLIEDIDIKELNPLATEDGVFTRLYDRLFTLRNGLMMKRGLDYNDATLSTPVMSFFDSINALEILSEKCKNITELRLRINRVFNSPEEGVCLSTIHKSKGLEAENVYILCHSTMPSKLAKKDWEKLQERNLQYVAYTRAKNRLGFISEKEIRPMGVGQEPMEIINQLSQIEQHVCDILGKEVMNNDNNVELAKFNVKKATKIEEDLHKDDNVVVMNKPEVVETQNNTINDDLLSQLSDYLGKDGDNLNKLKEFLNK